MAVRFGTVLSLPNEYSRYARVHDEESGIGFTVEPHKIPDDTEEDDDLAYKVEIWENDSGLVYWAEED